MKYIVINKVSLVNVHEQIATYSFETNIHPYTFIYLILTSNNISSSTSNPASLLILSMSKFFIAFTKSE